MRSYNSVHGLNTKFLDTHNHWAAREVLPWTSGSEINSARSRWIETLEIFQRPERAVCSNPCTFEPLRYDFCTKEHPALFLPEDTENWCDTKTFGCKNCSLFRVRGWLLLTTTTEFSNNEQSNQSGRPSWARRGIRPEADQQSRDKDQISLRTTLCTMANATKASPAAAGSYQLAYRNTPRMSTSRINALIKGTLISGGPIPTRTKVPPDLVAWNTQFKTTLNPLNWTSTAKYPHKYQVGC